MKFTSKYKAFAAVAVAIMLLAVLCGGVGCKKASPENPGSAQPTKRPSSRLIAYVIHDDDSDDTCLKKYGFTRAAKGLAYSSKIYTYTDESELNAVISAVNADGADGAILDTIENEQVRGACAAYLNENNIPFITLFSQDADVYINPDTHHGEAAIMLAQHVATAENGAILVYCDSTTDNISELCKNALTQGGYATSVLEFKRTEYSAQGAATELGTFLEGHPEVLGIYAVKSTYAAAAVKAVNALQRKGVMIIGSVQTQANVKLIKDGDIEALCVNPLYDAVSDGVYMLSDKLNGREITKKTPVYHIVNSDSITRYENILTEARNAFSDKTDGGN